MTEIVPASDEHELGVNYADKPSDSSPEEDPAEARRSKLKKMARYVLDIFTNEKTVGFDVVSVNIEQNGDDVLHFSRYERGVPYDKFGESHLGSTGEETRTIINARYYAETESIDAHRMMPHHMVFLSRTIRINQGLGTHESSRLELENELAKAKEERFAAIERQRAAEAELKSAAAELEGALERHRLAIAELRDASDLVYLEPKQPDRIGLTELAAD